MEITLSMDQQMDMYSSGGRPRIRRIRYEPPVDETFVLKRQLSSIYVIMRNTSGNFLKMYGSADDPTDLISFELTDEKGRTTIIRKKKNSSASDQRPISYAKPGLTQAFNVYLDPNVWENVVKVTPGKSTTYTLRAVLDNKVNKFYSKPYKLIMDGTHAPGAEHNHQSEQDTDKQKPDQPQNSDNSEE